MKIKTGQTIYESIVSIDMNNNPISAATLTTYLYKNGIICTESSVDISLTDAINAIFTASWSAVSYGSYQLYSKNNTTNIIYISDVYFVVPDDDEVDAVVYVGL
jgi:hypothetical protein